MGNEERERYFVLHAPRQVGKTSYLLALMKHLNEAGRYECVYLNAEIGQSAREDVGEAMRAILRVRQEISSPLDSVGRPATAAADP